MRKMKRHVRTGLGTSKATYQEEEGNTPLDGELQGKGDVMSLWTLTSNAIMSIHEKMSKMIKFVHVTKETLSERNMDAYVDDADLYVASEETVVHNKQPICCTRRRS